MKINSNFRDFYDYVVGIVGIDNDRNFFRVTKEIKPVNNGLKIITNDLMKECESGYTITDFKSNKTSLKDFRNSFDLSGGNAEPPSSLSNYINNYYESSILHRIYRLSAEVFIDFENKLGGASIYPCILVFGSKVTIGFVAIKSSFVNGVSVNKAFDPIMSLNNLDTFLCGDDFKKMSGYKPYENLKMYVKYLIHAGTINGLDVDGEVPFGKFQDFLGKKEVSDYNKKVDSPVSLIVYSGMRRATKYKGDSHSNSYHASANDKISLNKIESVVINPVLISSGIQMLMCPMQAYQDIDMAVSEINNVEKEVKFTDKVMIESKGFDNKTSFRKTKSKN